MKKNKMLRLAAVLLVAVMMTTCVISGTFAKYVTSASAEDHARVAKWGVAFDMEGGPLFAKEYKLEDSRFNSVSTEMSVKADENVVAPGTKGTLVSFRVVDIADHTKIPQAEVSYEVKFTVDDTDLETIFTNYKYNAAHTDVEAITNGYYPVVFSLTIGDTTTKYNDITALKAAVNGLSYVYDVNSGLFKYSVGGEAKTSATVPEFSINWAWSYGEYGTYTGENGGLPLGTDATFTGVVGGIKQVNDDADTLLGDLADGFSIGKTEGTDYNLEINFKVNATATQID